MQLNYLNFNSTSQRWNIMMSKHVDDVGMLKEKANEKSGNLGGRISAHVLIAFFSTLSLSSYAFRSNVVWLRGR